MIQEHFDDLYTVIYKILDDAKTDRRLLKVYKGSHGSSNPHREAADFGGFFAWQRRGLFAHSVERIHPYRPAHLAVPADLAAFDETHSPRVSTAGAFKAVIELLRQEGEDEHQVLQHLVSRKHFLGRYRAGTSGYDDEARAFVAVHLQGAGIPVRAEDLLVYAGGAKGAILAFCAAIMCRRINDEVLREGGLLAAPSGFYQSLRLIPTMFGGRIDVLDDLTGDAVARWLNETADEKRRGIYVPLVNNADGRVLTREQAVGIGEVVLRHNRDHPNRAVYVLADDVYVGSILDRDLDAVSIASITGADVGDPALGRMVDWTLAVVTASKTFALPTARVAFAATTSPTLRAAAAHYRTVLSFGRVPQGDELLAAAAIAFTPQSWIDAWNDHYRRALRELVDRITPINHRLGYEALRIDSPQGGWYFPLRIARRLIPSAVSSVDAYSVLLHHADPGEPGLGLLPGELFGKHSDDGFFLRGSLAVGTDLLQEFAYRLGHAADQLHGRSGEARVRQALTRARKIADIDQVLGATRY